MVTPSRGQAVRATFELECRRANQSVLLSYVDHDGSVAQVRPYLNPYLTLYLTPYLMDHDGSVAQVRPYLTLNHILAPYFTLYLTPYLMDHDGSVAQVRPYLNPYVTSYMAPLSNGPRRVGRAGAPLSKPICNLLCNPLI